jgi:hypothetical protein
MIDFWRTSKGTASLVGRGIGAIAVAVLLVGGCSIASPVVASVNGSVISRDWLDSAERAFDGSRVLQEELGIAPPVVVRNPQEAQGAPGLSGPQLRVALLARRIELEIIDTALGRLGLDPVYLRERFEEKLRRDLEQKGQGNVPKAALVFLSQWQADQFMLVQALAPSEPTTAALRNIFEIQPSFGAKLCFSVIKLDRQEEAEKVVERLRAGESFSQLAQDFSTDLYSKPRRGSVGCITQVEAFEKLLDPLPFLVAYQLADNQARGPIQSETGAFWFVRRAEGSTGFDFESALPQLQEQYPKIRGILVEDHLAKTAMEADVRVACPEGRWIPERFTIAPCGDVEAPALRSPAEVPEMGEVTPTAPGDQAEGGAAAPVPAG